MDPNRNQKDEKDPPEGRDRSNSNEKMSDNQGKTEHKSTEQDLKNSSRNSSKERTQTSDKKKNVDRNYHRERQQRREECMWTEIKNKKHQEPVQTTKKRLPSIIVKLNLDKKDRDTFDHTYNKCTKKARNVLTVKSRVEKVKRHVKETTKVKSMITEKLDPDRTLFETKNLKQIRKSDNKKCDMIDRKMSTYDKDKTTACTTISRERTRPEHKSLYKSRKNREFKKKEYPKSLSANKFKASKKVEKRSATIARDTYEQNQSSYKQSKSEEQCKNYEDKDKRKISSVGKFDTLPKSKEMNANKLDLRTENIHPMKSNEKLQSTGTEVRLENEKNSEKD